MVSYSYQSELLGGQLRSFFQSRLQDIKADGGVQDKLGLVFVRGKGVCLCPIRVSASKSLSRGGKWRLVTQRCVITETAHE